MNSSLCFLYLLLKQIYFLFGKENKYNDTPGWSDFGGGIETGWKRARQLSTQKFIPIEDLRYMRNWFARHIYASYPSYKMWVKAGKPLHEKKWHNKHGIISWYIWGSDPAFKWVNSQKNISLLNKEYGKSYESLKLK